MSSQQSSKRKSNSGDSDYAKHLKLDPIIISRVQAQDGVRGRIVLVSYSSSNTPYTILRNGVDAMGFSLNVTNLNLNMYSLSIEGEVIATNVVSSKANAKNELSEIALKELQKTCFTIIRKVNPADSPKIEITPTTSKAVPQIENEPQSPMMKGIGAKMMQQMGWSGGGLGSQGQGRVDIVQPYIQIHRQGLGSKNVIQEIKKILQNHVQSQEITSLAFSTDFTKDERAQIHMLARKVNLKSRSYGDAENRTLVVRGKFNLWDLVHRLVDVGGENEEYKLILPTNIDCN